jgi:bifunctional non-homologous end joining protein LigD
MAARNPLATYNAKRDFKKTREPKGERGRAQGNRFIVQKHDATRLHYDFRLELDGVLKSWAVTKGPSSNPEDKRLAVRTEDHPLAYGNFEGTIPEAEYGGGTVMLWDDGTWAPIPGKDPRKTLEEGHLHFILHGQRMKGEWLLVRMKPRPKEKRENWLLRKVEDEFAGASDDLVDREVTSVVSGRSMAEIAKGDDVWHSDKARAKADPQWETKGPPLRSRKNGKTRAKGKPPAFRQPQLATLVDHVPFGPGWLHEVKYDGYRALIAVGGGKARAFTRTGLDWSEKFAGVVEAFEALDLPTCLIDGEVAALDDKGHPSFGRLQEALKEGGAPLSFFAFDLLEEEGEDLTGLSNRERKTRLEALLRGAPEPIHYAEHVEAGEKLFEALCREGYEGIVSKRADAPYRGRRTQSWLKIKCTCRQEFVIIGWTASDKARGFRSLLLGTKVGDTLHYAGKAGTGFTMQRIDDLLAKLRPLERKTAPVDDAPRAAVRGAHWVTPKLVAEIAYTETTAPLGQGGVLRHPSFIGLREDKPAEEVRPEKALSSPARGGGPAHGRWRGSKAGRIARDTPPPPRSVRSPSPSRGGYGITISNPDRVIYPENGITKGELASYYAAMADPILRFAAGRPVSLVRCPQGRAKHCFFQKHDSGSFGDSVHHVPITEKDGDKADYLYVEDGAGLIACVQMGAIEFHGWGSLADDIEHPDRMVFDLDPDEGLDFEGVKKAALVVKQELAAMGLQSDPMLSGGKGIHVIVQLDRSADWDMVKDFASRFARALAEARPEMFTANMKKVERKGRIFLDWLRNQRGATAIMPWAARARERAPVATPVTWEELEGIDRASAFTIADLALLRERAASRTIAKWCAKPQALPGL